MNRKCACGHEEDGEAKRDMVRERERHTHTHIYIYILWPLDLLIAYIVGCLTRKAKIWPFLGEMQKIDRQQIMHFCYVLGCNLLSYFCYKTWESAFSSSIWAFNRSNALCFCCRVLWCPSFRVLELFWWPSKSYSRVLF